MTVKGRRKRSAPKESENKRHKRNAEIEENKRPKRQADEEKVSEKITPVGAETEEKHVTTPQGQQVTAAPGQQVTTPAGGQQVTIATTPAHTTVYFDSVFDKWSSISSKASEFFLDNRKQLRKRKSTDKRYNMVMNIFKRHRMKMYNRSDYTYSTITPRSTKGPSTSPRTRVWPRWRVSTVVYDYLTHTEGNYSTCPYLLLQASLLVEVGNYTITIVQILSYFFLFIPLKSFDLTYSIRVPVDVDRR